MDDTNSRDAKKPAKLSPRALSTEQSVEEDPRGPPERPRGKSLPLHPTTLPLNGNNTQKSTLKPPVSPKKPHITVRTLSPLHEGGQRPRMAATAGSYEKSSSLDENERSKPRGSSNSDSSSLNTVFTSASERNSPSAVSDISVFSSDVQYDVPGSLRRVDADKGKRKGSDHRKSQFPQNISLSTSYTPAATESKNIHENVISVSAPDVTALTDQGAPAIKGNKSRGKVEKPPKSPRSVSTNVMNIGNQIYGLSQDTEIPAYEDIEVKPKVSPVAPKVLEKRESEEDSYTYVGGGGESGKWSLQHIALGKDGTKSKPEPVKKSSHVLTAVSL